MRNRAEYIRGMQAKLDGWSSEIEKLTDRTSEVTAEVKHDFNRKIESLKDKLTVAWKKIELARSTSTIRASD
jgi:hypothetical protein